MQKKPIKIDKILEIKLGIMNKNQQHFFFFFSYFDSLWPVAVRLTLFLVGAFVEASLADLVVVVS
jgi:hypothetical protein